LAQRLEQHRLRHLVGQAQIANDAHHCGIDLGLGEFGLDLERDGIDVPAELQARITRKRALREVVRATA
ncbi:MAG: hypothetical protein ACPGNT_09135, partial [Rhodospirillales bacterium]